MVFFYQPNAAPMLLRELSFVLSMIRGTRTCGRAAILSACRYIAALYNTAGQRMAFDGVQGGMPENIAGVLIGVR